METYFFNLRLCVDIRRESAGALRRGNVRAAVLRLRTVLVRLVVGDHQSDSARSRSPYRCRISFRRGLQGERWTRAQLKRAELSHNNWQLSKNRFNSSNCKQRGK